MPFLLTLILPMQVAHEISKNKGGERLLRDRSKSVLGFASRQWVVIGLQMVLLGLDKQVTGNNLEKMFLYPQSVIFKEHS